MNLDETIEHAEKLLFALALELRGVPLQEERTRALHVRALELKRDIAQWRSTYPDPASCEAVFGEIEALTRDVQMQRSALREET